MFDVEPLCHPPPAEAPAEAAWEPADAGRRLRAAADGGVKSQADDAAWWRNDVDSPLHGAGVGGELGAGRKLQLNRWQRKRQNSQIRVRRWTQPGITETAIPEIGPQREQLHAWRAGEIQRDMAANLRATGWLGDFEPMQMNCPLLGRRISADAVSDFAAQAWQCGGLGFDASCLGNV